MKPVCIVLICTVLFCLCLISCSFIKSEKPRFHISNDTTHFVLLNNGEKYRQFYCVDVSYFPCLFRLFIKTLSWISLLLFDSLQLHFLYLFSLPHLEENDFCFFLVVATPFFLFQFPCYFFLFLLINFFLIEKEKDNGLQWRCV